MSNNLKYRTYNQIIKEFDVYIMQVSKQTYQFKLVKRLDGDKPPRITLEKLAEMMQEGFNKINQRIDNLVKMNNLIE